MAILKLILGIFGKLFFKYLSAENENKLESENESLKGRADSIGESYEQQDAARKAAEEAKAEVESQGSDDDILGSEDYNEV